MRQRVAALAATFMLCLPCWADTDWVPMNGAEIDAALRDRELTYDNATQHFYGSTRTRYTSGRDSWGYWRVEADKYCSQWPPADGWACYRMARRADNSALKFIGDSGAETVGVYEN